MVISLQNQSRNWAASEENRYWPVTYERAWWRNSVTSSKALIKTLSFPTAFLAKESHASDKGKLSSDTSSDFISWSIDSYSDGPRLVFLITSQVLHTDLDAWILIYRTCDASWNTVSHRNVQLNLEALPHIIEAHHNHQHIWFFVIFVSILFHYLPYTCIHMKWSNSVGYFIWNILDGAQEKW